MRTFEVTAFGEPLQERELDIPTPKGAEVLVKVRSTGVCHSDLYVIDGYYELGGGKRLKVTDRGVKLPHTLGHEVAGEVVALGPDAAGGKPGDVRVVFPWIGCGVCPACLRGTENLCRAPNYLGIHRPGGYADYVIVPNAKYLLEIDPLTPEQAAPLACSGLTAYSALKKLGPLLHTDPVAIIGAGGVGLMAFTLVKALGGFGSIAIDISAEKRDAAIKAGAMAAVDPMSATAVADIQAAAPQGLLAVIDFVGSTATAELGLSVLARGGTYIVVGFYGGDLQMPIPYIPMRALTIRGSYTGSLGELHELMTLARRGDIPAANVASAPLAQVNDVLTRLRHGKIIGRTVVVP